jgi:signal peptidase I
MTRSLARWSVLVLLVAGSVIRLAGYQGVWPAVRITGGSMAPTLVGEHYRLICRDCQMGLRYDAQAPPRDSRVVCWNCGAANDHRIDQKIKVGQRVLIDRSAFAWGTPNRWDIVAFPMPHHPNRWAVKRIVGLPGERIEFRQGNVVANGRTVRKTLAQLRRMAVLVHDNDYQPKRDLHLPPRWNRQSSESKWRADETRLIFQPRKEGCFSLDWLEYQHWPGYAGLVQRTQPSPIMDNDNYNQQLSRRLNVLADIMLACRIQIGDGDGCLALEITDRTDRYRVELCFQHRQLVWFRNFDKGSRIPLPKFAFARGVFLEFAWCDGQLLFAIDGHPLVRQEFKDRDSDRAKRQETENRQRSHSRDSISRIALGAKGTEVTVDRLRVFRDVHYVTPDYVYQPRNQWLLGPDELFVIGDNGPLSQDSRHWPHSGLPVRHLWGRVWGMK